jgi:octaprenyl-diphosphate synthase
MTSVSRNSLLGFETRRLFIFSRLLHQRLQRRGYDFEEQFRESGFWDELLELDSSFLDIMSNEGFSSGWFIAPGVPRIRPILIYLSSEVARTELSEKVERSRLRHLALATELFYGAILVHDLTLGKQGGKRRRLARRVLGKALEWYGGNGLLTRALELVMMTRSSDVMSEFVMAMREVQEAQEESKQWKDTLPSEDEMISYAENYTGSMFSFACRSGGLLSGGSRREVNLLGRYGRQLGVAWQLTEELSALDSSFEIAKQSLEEQLSTKRPFYPLICAAEESSEVRDLWDYLLNKEDEDALDSLVQKIQRSPAIPQTRQRIGEFSWTARKIARALPQSQHRNHLESLAEALAK